MDALLVAEELRKSFVRSDRVLEVLRGVDLSIAPAESLAIMGPSGSGKSTLLNLLSGLDAPDGGRVVYRGDDLAVLKPDAISDWRRDNLGFIFQFHFLLPDLTALENLLVPVRLQGRVTAEDEERAYGLLADMGLAERCDHRPGELSGGEQQRVAVARAFMNGPELILADEPFGNLDQGKGRELADLLFSWSARDGRALVVVTHDPHLAGRASRILDLRDGVLAALDGAPS